MEEEVGFPLAHHLEEFALELRIVLLLLESRLVGDALLAQADVAEVVFGIELLEEFRDVLVGLVVVDDAAELGVDDEDYTAPEHVVVAEILVNHRLLRFFHACSGLPWSRGRLTQPVLCIEIGIRRQDHLNVLQSHQPPEVDRVEFRRQDFPVLGKDIQSLALVERLCVPVEGLLDGLLGVEVDALEVALILHQVTDWHDRKTLSVLLSESLCVDSRVLVLPSLELLDPAEDLDDVRISFDVLPVVVALAGHLVLGFRTQWHVGSLGRLTENPFDHVQFLAIEGNQYCEVEQVIIGVTYCLGETEVFYGILEVSFDLLDLIVQWRIAILSSGLPVCLLVS